MSDAAHVVLQRVLEKATFDLFAIQGVALKAMPSPGALQPTTATIAGVVGFTGETMRGMLMIASSFPVFARTRPQEVKEQALSPEVARDWVLLRDWAAEVANQLLGRVKNELFSYGLTLHVSTPTALSGKALSVATPSSRRATPLLFSAGSADDDEVWVWWDAVMDPDLLLVDGGGENAAREGDVILF